MCTVAVMESVVPVLRKLPGQQVFRAKFSAISEKDVRTTMSSLGEPNKNEALSIDARQKIDLKVGVAFTRFQARYFQGKYSNCFSSCLWFPLAETHRRASFGIEIFKLWRKLTLPPRLEMSPLHGDEKS